MLTIALDTRNHEMRMQCSAGRTHDELRQGLQAGGFRHEDLGAFFIISGSQDWPRVLTALGIEPARAFQRGGDGTVLTVSLRRPNRRRARTPS